MNTRHPFRSLLIALSLAAIPLAGQAQAFSVGVSIRVAPPALPIYVQPALPGPGYIWAPGYWAWGAEGYYWVPGTWVLAPRPGLLWTPGYWGWADGLYLWHAGYWGPHVGFYGGVNYGFGYVGVGYVGGYWRGGGFFYNRAVNNFGAVHVTNVYNQTVVNNVTVNRVSYNGGTGGIAAQPSASERQAAAEPHVHPTELQSQHEHAAGNNRALLASVNHGTPRLAATTRAGVFNQRGAGAGAPAARRAQHDGGAPPYGRQPHGGRGPVRNGPGAAAHAEQRQGETRYR